MTRKYKNVHDAHCCKIHGCKYCDDDCSVVNGSDEGIKCEGCYLDDEDPDKQEIKRLNAELKVAQDEIRAWRINYSTQEYVAKGCYLKHKE